jgi:hypothetical protein
MTFFLLLNEFKFDQASPTEKSSINIERHTLIT